MSVKNRKTRTVASEPLPQLSSRGSEPAISGDSFHAALSNCAQADQEMPMESISTVRRVEKIRWQGVCSDVLTRAWSSLQAKYKTSTTKRLHVSETISLGEKRFVAIVAVEGREFLIGGGVSGMSLLAQLGSGPGATRDFGQKFGDGGGVL
jgi:Flagellar biosynthesis protein, FliO